MGWLDSIIEKGKIAANANCDPPWTADYDWPLRKQPPSIVSTAPENAEPMVPVGPLCPGWYTREFIHTSPSTGKTMSVTKWYNSTTGVTQWTAPAGGLAYFQQDFPELYALFAPLPKDAPISDDLGDNLGGATEGEIEDYIKTIGSKDPEVPPEAKPPVTEQIKRAGFPLWLGLLIGGGVIGAIIYNSRKKKGKKGGLLARRSKRPAYTKR